MLIRGEYNMGKFSYICVNFLRKEHTKKCVISLLEQYPKANIFVADQDEPSLEMEDFYKNYNVNYFYLPYDCGLSYCRNFLIDKITDDYIMWGDNDFIFDNQSNIQEGISLLESHSDIGVVGGAVLKNNRMTHYERQILYDRDLGILIYIPLKYTEPKEHLHNGNPYYYCDITFNYAIAKSDMFKDSRVRWNPNIKVRYEHTDMFLRIKCYSKYKAVYFPYMKVHHEHGVDDAKYKAMRYRREDGQAFAKDWNLRMNFTIGDVREVYNESITPILNLKKKYQR